MWWNPKTHIAMKVKKLNCDETQKLKLWWYSKTKIVMKPKTHIVMKLKNSNWAEPQNPNSEKKNYIKKNSNGEKNQKLKWWQNSKTQIGTKLKHLNSTKSKKKTKWWQNSNGTKGKIYNHMGRRYLNLVAGLFLSSNLEWHFHDKKKGPNGANHGRDVNLNDNSHTVHNVQSI